MAENPNSSSSFIAKRFQFQNNLNALLSDSKYVKPSSKTCNKCQIKNRICVCETIHKEIGSSKAYVIEELLDCKRELNELRDCLNDIDINKWSKHTNLYDNTSLVHSTLAQTEKGEAFELLTNAWIKFYEILYQCNLLDMCDPPVSGTVTSFHIAECPGSFICALNHYLQTVKDGIRLYWKATSLNPYFEGNNHNVLLKEDILFRDTYHRWLKGVDDSGDITIKENVEFIWNSARPNKHSKELFLADIVTADGSFNCQHAPNQQEVLTAHLIYSELVCALGMLRVGGVLVVKAFTLFEHSSLSIFSIISMCFKKIEVVKPHLSKESNSEIYILGIGFNGIGSALLSKLCSLIGKVRDNAIVPLSWIPPEFKNEFITCAKYFSDLQMRWLRQTVSLYEQPSDENKLYKEKREFAKKFIEKNKLTPLSPSKRVIFKPTFIDGLLTGADTSSMGHMDHRWFPTLHDRVLHFTTYTTIQKYRADLQDSVFCLYISQAKRSINTIDKKEGCLHVLPEKNVVIDKLTQSLTSQSYLKENWFSPVRALKPIDYKMSFFVDNDLIYDCLDFIYKNGSDINAIDLEDSLELFCSSGEILSDPEALPSASAIDLALIFKKFEIDSESINKLYSVYAEVTTDTKQRFGATCLLKRHCCSGNIIFTKNTGVEAVDKDSNFQFESDSDLMNGLDSFVGNGKILTAKILDLLGLFSAGKGYKQLLEENVAEKRSCGLVYLDPVSGFPYYKDVFLTEVKSKIFLIGQLVIGINLIADGGDLIIRLSTTLTRFTICIILALRCVFDNVNVYRPPSVPSWTRSVYLVCKNFNDKDNCLFRHYIQCLWDANVFHNQSRLTILQPLLPIYFTAPAFSRPFYEYNTMLFRNELERLKTKTGKYDVSENECRLFVVENLNSYLYPGDLGRYAIIPTVRHDEVNNIEEESPIVISPDPSPTLLEEIWCT